MASRNYYEVLGIDKGASQEEIKKAYRALSKQHHPDHGGDEEKFKELNEAYSTLSNPEKRKDYDNPMRGNPFGDIFDGFGFPGFRPGFRQSPRHDPNAPRRGRNIVLEHELPLKFFILGGKFKVNFSLKDNCVECGGTGASETIICSVCDGSGVMTDAKQHQGIFIQSSSPCTNCRGSGRKTTVNCEYCNGSGHIEGKREVELDVPVGVREGTVLGAAGYGGSGLNGGPPGDLGVKIYMKYPKLNELTEEQKKVLEEL